MQKGQRYMSLSARDVKSVQNARLKQRHELAEESVLAETVAELTGQIIKEDEARMDIKRVRPGEVVIERDGQRLCLPLLSPVWACKLREGLSVSALRRHTELEQWQVLEACQTVNTIEDLWKITNQAEIIKNRAPKGFNFLPEEPLDIKTLSVQHMPGALEAISKSGMDKAIDVLVTQYGCRPSQAESMVQTAAEAYVGCCPRVDDLQHGQLVWLSHSTERKRYRGILKPIILTLQAPSDSGIPLRHRGDLKHLKTLQIERLTAEAWIQDGVLTLLDLEWLLNISPAMARQIIDKYHENFGVILPTAGTVLDMGRTMTHKRIVIELTLAGHTTKEIATRIRHTEKAVDDYIRAFIRVLLLLHHRVPLSAMLRVTGHSRSLIKEHLALAQKHFPTPEALAEYLNQQGIPEEELYIGA